MIKSITLILAMLTFMSCGNHLPDINWVKNQHIVKIKSNAKAEKVFKGKAFKIISNDTYLVKGSVDDLNQDLIKYSEPNYIWNIVEAPNDPKFNKLWGMKSLSALKAWKETKGSKDVKVMVIDTGIDYNHPDLKANVWTNTVELNGKEGVDDDNNGCIDDIHGCDFQNNDGDPMDDHSHGTHCSGTIGAVHNNRIGVAGVMGKVTLVGCKFLGASGGSTEGAIKCIDYGIAVGVDVMSNSWGGGGHSNALKEAIERANEAGIMFIAAAGNDGTDNDAKPHYPSNYDIENVIAVASHTDKNMLSSFSCYGKNTVHIAAPGSNILSTVLNGKYESYNGTSMATPHVSGAIGLLLSMDKTLSVSEIKERLMATSVPVKSFKSKIKMGGKLDAYNLVMNIRPERKIPDESKWITVKMDIESAHPYADKETITKVINVPNAEYIRIIIKKIDVENRYDKIQIKDSSNTIVDIVTGTKENYITEPVEGNTLNFEFTSDRSQTKWGFIIEEYQYQ